MSAEALLRPTAHPERPDLLIYDAAPSDRDVPIALLAAFWAYANLMRLVLPGSQRDALVAFYRENMPLFFRPKPGDADQEPEGPGGEPNA
jgi:hypothetical protein